MRILMVNKYLYPRGGAEVCMLQTGEQLQKMGHQVSYFGMEDPRNTVGNGAGVFCRAMDFRSRGTDRFLYPFRILYSLEAKRKLKQVIRVFRPDIVHLHNLYYHLTPSVIDAAAELGVPMVQTVHDAQPVCPNHMLLLPRTLKLCERCVEGSKWNCAAQRCIHGSLIKSILGSIEGSLYQRLPILGKVSRFICPSRFMEQLLLRDRRFTGRTLVMQNFVRPGGAAGRHWEKEDYILYFGRLSEEKGIACLLEACRLLPEIPFVFAGSGPLEGLLYEHCPSNVQYAGFQTGEALEELIGRARLAVYPSVWYENCPMSLLEAQSLGTPVLASRIGGIPELIADGATGILTDASTPEQWAGEIRRIWLDREQLAALSAGCSKRRDLITLEAYCEELVELYQSVIGGRKGG